MNIIKFIKSSHKAKKIKQNEWRKINFHFGDVVQTQHGHDRGLVTKVNKDNMPDKVMSAPAFSFKAKDYTDISYYGGVNSVRWYKTGEHMTPQQWMKIYSTKEGWQRYCKDRSNQIKFNEQGVKE